MQSFLIPEKILFDTILQTHHSVVYQNNAQSILYWKHIRFFATLRHFGRYQQFYDALYGVYTNVFRQVQKL